MKKIVSAKWLNKNLNNPNLIVLDASMESNANGTAFEKYNGTIPNAIKFDLKNNFSDKTSPFPNTVPKPNEFELECRKLGINKNSEIIVFDNNGVYSSPRVWWLFKVMGHKNVAVLNGGLPNWIETGYPIVKNHQKVFKTGNFKANYNENLVVNFQQVKNNISEKNFTIVDARSEKRFNGLEEEPRKHLKSGNIQNSINIPYQEVLSNGKFKPKKELTALFKNKCTEEKELVFSCGSGLTACIIMLACEISYANSQKVYDGSWTEWAELNNLKTNI